MSEFLRPSYSLVIEKCGPWFKVPYERLDEPDDKTYYSTMYVLPAKTQVSLCIDPLYKASFLDSPQSEEGAYCTISEESDQNVTLVIPVWTARLSKLNTTSECSDQNMQLHRLTRIFARRTRRFVKPIDCRRYIRLAKALIRLLMCRLRVCRLIRLFVQVSLSVLPCTDPCAVCLCRP